MKLQTFARWLERELSDELRALAEELAAQGQSPAAIRRAVEEHAKREARTLLRKAGVQIDAWLTWERVESPAARALLEELDGMVEELAELALRLGLRRLKAPDLAAAAVAELLESLPALLEDKGGGAPSRVPISAGPALASGDASVANSTPTLRAPALARRMEPLPEPDPEPEEEPTTLTAKEGLWPSLKRLLGVGETGSAGAARERARAARDGDQVRPVGGGVVEVPP
jgi:hypothetical protein